MIGDIRIWDIVKALSVLVGVIVFFVLLLLVLITVVHLHVNWLVTL